jgi:hypothetical protein
VRQEIAAAMMLVYAFFNPLPFSLFVVFELFKYIGISRLQMQISQFVE